MILKACDDEEFDELCLETAKMKKGHYRKLQMWRAGKYNPKPES